MPPACAAAAVAAQANGDHAPVWGGGGWWGTAIAMVVCVGWFIVTRGKREKLP